MTPGAIYSRALLDSSGTFSTPKFLLAFFEAAAREHLDYPLATPRAPPSAPAGPAQVATYGPPQHVVRGLSGVGAATNGSGLPTAAAPPTSPVAASSPLRQSPLVYPPQSSSSSSSSSSYYPSFSRDRIPQSPHQAPPSDPNVSRDPVTAAAASPPSNRGGAVGFPSATSSQSHSFDTSYGAAAHKGGGEEYEAVSDDEDDDNIVVVANPPASPPRWDAAAASSQHGQAISSPPPYHSPSPCVYSPPQVITNHGGGALPPPTPPSVFANVAAALGRSAGFMMQQQQAQHQQQVLSKVDFRLKLVLDLDNTLLHACARSKIGNCQINLIDFMDDQNRSEMYKFVLPPPLVTQEYYVKLRPGLRSFLQSVSQYCDLAIHTNATREYADVIVAILDPDRTLFGSRVAAREDDTAKDHKKNMDRLFGTDDLDVSSLLILDDRKDVWDEMFQANILHCGMYDYLESRKNALIQKYNNNNEDNSNNDAALLTTATATSNSSTTTTTNNMITATPANVDIINNYNSSVYSAQTAPNNGASAYYDGDYPPDKDRGLLDDAGVYHEVKRLRRDGPPTQQHNNNNTANLIGALAATNLIKAGGGAGGSASGYGSNAGNDAAASDSCPPQQQPFLDNPLVTTADETNTEALKPEDDTDEDEEGGQPLSSSGGAASGASSSIEAALANPELSVDETLLDYDRQLEYMTKLIVDVAEEFNRRKKQQQQRVAPLSTSYDRSHHPHPHNNVRYDEGGNTTTTTTTTAAGPSDISVASILAEKRRSVLQGVVVRTVGMYKAETSHPEHGWHDNGPMHRRRLVSLGAQVVETLTPDLTHILAMRATQTIDRVRRERGDEVKYVHALWLHACENTWQRVPEDWFGALPLMKRYSYNPPKKPWVDHWRIAAIAQPELRQALLARKQTSGNSLPPAEQQSQQQRSLQAAPSRSTTTRFHIILGPFSNGAHVWSATEHIILKFDPLESARLRERLERESRAQRQQQQLQQQQGDAISVSPQKQMGSRQGEWWGKMTPPPSQHSMMNIPPAWQNNNGDNAANRYSGSRRKRRRSSGGINNSNTPSPASSPFTYEDTQQTNIACYI